MRRSRLEAHARRAGRGGGALRRRSRSGDGAGGHRGHRDGGASGWRRARQEGLLHRRGLPAREGGRRRWLLLRRFHRRLPGRGHARRRAHQRREAPGLGPGHSGLGPSDPAHRRGSQRRLQAGVPRAVRPDGRGVHERHHGGGAPEGRSSEHRRGGHQGRPGSPRRLTVCCPRLSPPSPETARGATSWRATSTWWSPTGSPAMSA